MSFQLENESLILKMKEQGAELTNIILKSDRTEYLWQGDSRFWGRHAPILFPIVGRLADDTYYVDSKAYHLSQHGFARDMVFEVTEKSGNTITYTLNSTGETLKKYPFSFSLDVTYELEGNSITVIYDVQNTNDEKMLFSIGAHPAFNVPFTANETFEDYYLDFDVPEIFDIYVLDKGLRKPSKHSIADPAQTLPLTKELFRDDALIFENLSKNKITIRSKNHSKFVEVEFPDFPYSGIWTPYNEAPFLCIEPWQGIADEVGEPADLQQKKGILSLQNGEIFSCRYTITVG
jgi:galactose mutarotase-like enzyme